MYILHIRGPDVNVVEGRGDPLKHIQQHYDKSDFPSLQSPTDTDNLMVLLYTSSKVVVIPSPKPLTLDP